MYRENLSVAQARFSAVVRFASPLIVCSVISACSLMPVARDLTQAEVIAKAGSSTDTSVDLGTAKKLLIGWRKEYAEAAQSRRRWQLGLGEAMFYGSVFATLGAITSYDHLRNLGIAAAGGSSLLGGHYQVGAQLAAFRKAVKKLECMEEATMQITPEDESLFPDITDQKQILVDLPARLVNRIRKVRTDLGDTLNNIELATPTKDEIANTFITWFQKKGAKPASGLSDNESPSSRGGFADPAAEAEAKRKLQMRKDRFVAALNKVNEEIEVCMTEPGG